MSPEETKILDRCIIKLRYIQRLYIQIAVCAFFIGFGLGLIIAHALK